MNNGDNPIQDLDETPKGHKIMMYVRTFIYILAVICAIASYCIDLYGYHQLAQVTALVGSALAGAFGVVFNPITNIGGKK